MSGFSRYILILGLLYHLGLHGQDIPFSHLKSKSFTLENSVISLDSLTIVPESLLVIVEEDTFRSQYFQIINERFEIAKDSLFQLLKGKEMQVFYRTLYINVNTVTSHLDTNMIRENDQIIYIGHDYSPYRADQDNAIFSEGLEYDGSFARGISFGNSQSLVLNSNFNLQIAGDLGDDLKIQGVISDENIPIQPEGNTQAIQEFDKVFIKINKASNEVVAGDYELQNPEGYFMRYFKKLKGLQASNITQLSPTQSMTSSANFASSRGKFARNQLAVQEGNQGPYKLQGNNGEVFFFVLAGTEKVYADGRLLERGLDRDYLIDYNLAEISFTAKTLVTKDLRIIVEFEYTDQSYNRTQYSFNTHYKSNKLNLQFAFFTEQDSKASTSAFELDSLDRATLENSGDELSLRSGIRLAEDFSQERIYYKKVFEPSITDSILVYTENPDSSIYTASFSDVGPGNGSYNIDNQATANGRVYIWVGPGNGRFEPVIRLVAPEKRQMMTLGMTYSLSDQAYITTELAMSVLDLNRFSNLQNGDNQGVASHLAYDHHFSFGDSLKAWKIQTKLEYEFAQENFNPLNPYRNTEFIRDWNYQDTLNTNEHLGAFQWTLLKSNMLSVRHKFSLLNRIDQYDGSKQDWDLQFNTKGFRVLFKGSFLKTNSSIEQSDFFRPFVSVSQQIPVLSGVRFGGSFERERNRNYQTGLSDLLNKSFMYEYIKLFVENADSQSLQWRISLNRRTDEAPDADNFVKATTADELQFNGQWLPGNQGSILWDFSFRDLRIDDATLTNQEGKKSYLGKIDINYKWLDGGIRTSSSYLLNNGQEAKLEFTFQEVQEGRGDYIWLDEDNDGVQDLNEFLPAPFADEANFIRVRVFNNEFINTNNIVWTQSLRIEPKRFIKEVEKSPLRTLVSKLSWIGNFRINQKTEELGDHKFSPFHFDIQDSSIVSYASSLNQSLFFNRGNPAYDLQINFRKANNKFVQITGFEINELSEIGFRARINLQRKFDLLFHLTKGEKKQDSELFDQNDFQLDLWNIKPEFSWRPNQKIRWIISYSYDYKQNTIGSELAKSHDGRIELSWRQAGNSRLNTKLSLTRINYNGDTNTSLELAILEGLKDGNNFLWNVDYTRRLANNLDIMVSYEGRKTGESRMVHIARAQIKASF